MVTLCKLRYTCQYGLSEYDHMKLGIFIIFCRALAMLYISFTIGGLFRGELFFHQASDPDR